MVTAAASPPPCGHVVRPARYLHDFHLKQNFSLHCCARRWHNVYLCVCLVSIFMFIISLCPQFLVKPQIQPGGGLDMQREISFLFLCTLSLSVRDSLKSFSFNYRLDMIGRDSSLLCYMFIILLCPQFAVNFQIQRGFRHDGQREISSLCLCTSSHDVIRSLNTSN